MEPDMKVSFVYLQLEVSSINVFKLHLDTSKFLLQVSGWCTDEVSFKFMIRNFMNEATIENSTKQ